MSKRTRKTKKASGSGLPAAVVEYNDESGLWHVSLTDGGDVRRELSAYCDKSDADAAVELLAWFVTLGFPHPVATSGGKVPAPTLRGDFSTYEDRTRRDLVAALGHVVDIDVEGLCRVELGSWGSCVKVIPLGGARASVDKRGVVRFERGK